MIDKNKIIKKVEPFEEEATSFLETLNVEIDSQEMFENFEALAKDAHENIKKLEEERKKITQPLTDAHKAVMALFKPPIEGYTKFKNLAKSKLMAYMRKCEAERTKALEKQEYKKTELLAQPPKPTAIRTQSYWTWKITDFDKIPRDYLTLDTSKMKITIREANAPEKLNIPGIEIFEEQSAVMR